MHIKAHNIIYLQNYKTKTITTYIFMHYINYSSNINSVIKEIAFYIYLYFYYIIIIMLEVKDAVEDTGESMKRGAKKAGHRMEEGAEEAKDKID